MLLCFCLIFWCTLYYSPIWHYICCWHNFLSCLHPAEEQQSRGKCLPVQVDFDYVSRSPYYLGITAAEDASIPVVHPATTFRHAVKSRGGERRHEQLRSVSWEKFLVHLIPSFCSCVEECYSGGRIVVRILTPKGKNSIIPSEESMLASSQGLVDVQNSNHFARVDIVKLVRLYRRLIEASREKCHRWS